MGERVTAHNKGIYNSRTWQRLRRLKLRTTPFCELCERVGRLVPAVVVDHIIGIEQGGPPFPTLDGLQSLCISCHNTKTRHVEQMGKQHIIVKGCDEQGLPIDGAHPFYLDPYTHRKDGQLAKLRPPGPRKFGKLGQ
jgi:5-methylcytosine-specific restriction protein A